MQVPVLDALTQPETIISVLKTNFSRVSSLFSLQVIKPQTALFVNQQLSVKIFHKVTNLTQHTSCFIYISLSRKVKTILTISKCQPGKAITHVVELIHIPQALNTGPASIIWNNEQGDLFYSAGPQRIRCKQQLTQEKLGRGFGKNAAEWARRVEISKEEIPGRSVACMARH